MNCQKIKKLLHKFVDGELGDKDKRIVENHLSQCSVCQKELKKIEAVNAIARVEITENVAPEYWSQLTRNIMDEINPTKVTRSFWQRLMDNIKAAIFSERINYRLVGLAATAVILFFFVRITFFDQGEFNLPPELSEMEIGSSQTREGISDKNLRDVDKKTESVANKRMEESAEKKDTGVKKSARGKERKIGVVGIDQHFMEEGVSSSQQSAGGKTVQILGESKEQEMSDQEKKGKVKNEVAAEYEESALLPDSYDADKQSNLKKEVEEVALIPKKEKVAGVPPRSREAGLAKAAKNQFSDQKKIKIFASEEKRAKKRVFDYQPVAIQAERPEDEAGNYLRILDEKTLSMTVEEKVNYLKLYLQSVKDSTDKNNAIFLLAKNLIELAKQRDTENSIKEALEFYFSNIDKLKKAENYHELKNEIELLKKKKEK